MRLKRTFFSTLSYIPRCKNHPMEPSTAQAAKNNSERLKRIADHGIPGDPVPQKELEETKRLLKQHATEGKKFSMY